MKLYDPSSVDKNTTIFTDQAVENVFSLLTTALDESNTPYQISEKSWKLANFRTYQSGKIIRNLIREFGDILETPSLILVVLMSACCLL